MDTPRDKPPSARRPAGSVREPTNLVVANEKGVSLEFTYPPQKPVSQYQQVPVKIDLDKMLADFPASGRTGGKKAPHPAWSYVPFANSSAQAAESDKSYRKIRSAIKGGQLDMPEFSGQSFNEGNHRLLELQRQGFKEIYILAYPDQAAEIEEKYGVGPKKYQPMAEASEPEAEKSDGPNTIEKSAVEKYVHRDTPGHEGPSARR